MRLGLRKDVDGTIRTEVVIHTRREHAVARHAVRPGQTMLGIPYGDWAKFAPGVVNLRGKRLSRAVSPDPALLEWLQNRQSK